MDSLSNFLVYRSSAGSGKTYTLVKEYLFLALQSGNPNTYGNILAITFTNKAANEMKQRVLKCLTVFADGKGESELQAMHTELTKRIGISNAELQHRAATTLENILHNYTRFSLTTIDKFVYNIIRTFSFDLKVPFSAEVETDTDIMLNHAINDLFAKIGNDEAFTDILVGYAIQKTEDEKNWDIHADLLEFGKELLREEGQRYVPMFSHLSPKDFSKIKNQLVTEINDFRKKITKVGKKAVDLIKENGIGVNDFYGVGGLGVYFTNLLEFNDDKLIAKVNARKPIDEDNWYAKSTPAELKEKIDGIQEELTDYFNQAQAVLEELPNYFFNKGLLQTIFGMAVLNELEKLLQQYCAEQNIVHISEFNKRIASIVKKEPAPFIYERIGERYDHFLIDEFQDTSVLQWSNMLPLLDESLSKGKFNMLVGDGKQAIYRWRDGEVEQFAALPKLYPQANNDFDVLREQTLTANYQPEILKDNWRSKKEIVEFNNAFFKQAAANLSENLAAIYAGGEQNPQGKAGGYVSVDYYNKEELANNENHPLNVMLNYIHKATEQGYQWNDITVLVRKNDDAVEVTDFLINNNIKVVSAESLLLQSSLKVQLVMSVLEYIATPNNPISRVKLISLLNAFNKNDANHSATKNAQKSQLQIPQLKSINKNLPLYELIESIISIFFSKEKPDSFVTGLMEFAHQFNKKNNRSLTDLLEHWEQKKDKLSINMAEGINAVNISSIHKSKGLEYPIVVIPFADWFTIKKTKNLWIENKETRLSELPHIFFPNNSALAGSNYCAYSEIEDGKNKLDHLNMLYVAFTRAAERLHIISEDRGSKFISQIIKNTLDATTEWDGKKYESGEMLSKKAEKENKSDNTNELKEIYSGKWQEKVAISYQAKQDWVAPVKHKALSYGKLVHSLFALIENEDALKSVWNIFNEWYQLTEDELKKMQQRTNVLFQHEEFYACFAPNLQVKNEAEVILPNGKSYRPDRVTFSETETNVIDYKTGQKREEHKVQLRNYCSILTEMGYSNVKGILAYFDLGEIEKV